jgi:hypothetical protein
MLTKQIQINQQNYRLVIGSHPFPQMCWKCHSTKKIVLVSYHEFNRSSDWSVRPFCYPCAWANLNELVTGDYEIPNKSQIVKDLRKALHG